MKGKKSLKFVGLIVIAVVIGLLAVTACGQAEPAEPTPSPVLSGFETYMDEKNGFSIEYPVDWEVAPTPDEGIFKIGDMVAGEVQAMVEARPLLEYDPELSEQEFFDMMTADIMENLGEVSTKEMKIHGVPAPGFFI